ncbi:MAG: hypothetical protein LBT24_03450 [Tannerella sp.]|nr:hypothetical protein [Tannerella sp.]
MKNKLLFLFIVNMIFSFQMVVAQNKIVVAHNVGIGIGKIRTFESGNGKLGLNNTFSADIILPAEYDSIVFFEDKFILPMINSRGTLYDAGMQEITNNVRAIFPLTYPNNDDYIFLQNNSLRYYTKEGQIIDTLPVRTFWTCGTVPYYHYQIKKTMNNKFNINFIESYSCEMVYNYHLSLNCKKLTFTNNLDEYNLNGNSKIGSIWFQSAEYLIFTEKNNKNGIVKWEKPTTAEVADTVHLISDEYGYKYEHDRIIHKPVDIKYEILVSGLDSITSEGIEFPLKIYKNGLYNYFPYGNIPKYKELGKPNGYFVRFVLPNKRIGWLSKDGKEYFDE